MRNSPENIEVRRNKVRLLISFKFPEAEIARQLGVCLRTITYDVREIRKDWGQQIKNIDLDQLIAELQFELDNRRRDLYAIVQREGTEARDKVSALRAIGEETDRFTRLLQNFGKLEKIPEKIDANVAYKIITAIPRVNNHENHAQGTSEKSARSPHRTQKRSSNLSEPDAKLKRKK